MNPALKFRLPCFSGLFTLLLSLHSCKEEARISVEPEEQPVIVNTSSDTVAPVPLKPTISYSLEKRKLILSDSSKPVSQAMLVILSDINRVDLAHLKRMDSIIVPHPLDLDRAAYSPFPGRLNSVADVNKILFFAYREEYFAAYEQGNLVLTGPTNMGKQKSKTPTGLFFTNWKSKESISTVDDEWILKWNFNVSNHGGVGFHQYALPGYPASHSCMRLKEDDAKFFYSWANQWKLDTADRILARGTPVIIFGAYPFGKKKPWLSLPQQPTSLEITSTTLDSIVAPHKEKILAEQKVRTDLDSRQIVL